MNKPIINPSTLSKEQREAITKMYNRFAYYGRRKDTECNECIQCLACDKILDVLFGSEFFQQ